MTHRAPACGRYRPVLVDLVDHGERTATTPAALDHLRVCPACEREITELALTIAALRRAGSAYRALRVPEATLVPAPQAARLASATARPGHRRWTWRLQLGALVTSAGLAALLVAPRLALAPQPHIPQAAPALPAAVTSWHAVEHRLAASPDVASVAALGTMPPRYPDGRLRPWKEVPSGDATARELEPS